MNIGIEIVDMLVAKVIAGAGRAGKSHRSTCWNWSGQSQSSRSMKGKKSRSSLRVSTATANHGLDSLLFANHALTLKLIVG